jgi:hypothetical protein
VQREMLGLSAGIAIEDHRQRADLKSVVHVVQTVAGSQDLVIGQTAMR